MKMKRLPAVVLAVLFGLSSLSVSAEVLINENFDYEAGPLHKGMDIPAPNDGGWYMFSGFGDNPVNVIDGSLTYADYAPDAVGRSVAMPKNGDDVLRAFNGVTSGTVYYSALVKVNAARKPAFGSIAPFLSFGNNTTSGVGGGVSVFSSGDGFKFGLSKIKEEATLFSEELTLGGTYLVVVKYEIVDGDDNDVISLFVNPVRCDEPAPVAKIDAQYEANNKADLSPVSSINLTQGTSSPDCIVDAVKVFTEWNDLFVKDTGDSPAIIPAEENISFGSVRNGKDYTKELTVRAKNLTGDIALSITEGDVTLSASSISKADAESEDGVTMTRSNAPVLFPAEDNFKDYDWPGGCEDPRVAMTEDGLYVMLYTSWNRKTARLSVATSRDLKHWTKHGPAFAEAYGGRFARIATKSASILTKVKDGKLVIDKVDGKYFMYWGEYAVYAATSDNLTDWYPVLDEKQELKKLASPRRGHFDSQMTECGPPAIRTRQGIILMYNGKNNPGLRGDTAYHAGAYCGGQMLFDNANPYKLLKRLDKPFFVPQEPFEKSGQYVNGTVFLEGLVYRKGKLYLYYGCADSRVSVAICTDTENLE